MTGGDECVYSSSSPIIQERPPIMGGMQKKESGVLVRVMGRISSLNVISSASRVILTAQVILTFSSLHGINLYVLSSKKSRKRETSSWVRGKTLLLIGNWRSELVDMGCNPLTGTSLHTAA